CQVRDRKQALLPKPPDPCPSGAPVALLHQDGREGDLQWRTGPPGIAVAEVGAEALINFIKPSGDSFHRGCSAHEPAQFFWFLRAKRLYPTAGPAQRFMVPLAQVVAAVLVAELVDEQAVPFLARPLLEPAVSEPLHVEVEPPTPVAGQERVWRVDERDGDWHA